MLTSHLPVRKGDPEYDKQKDLFESYVTSYRIQWGGELPTPFEVWLASASVNGGKKVQEEGEANGKE